jgi:hypothetical protein
VYSLPSEPEHHAGERTARDHVVQERRPIPTVPLIDAAIRYGATVTFHPSPRGLRRVVDCR